VKIAIVVNGKPMDADDTHVVADVMRNLGIAVDGDGIALAVNEAVVPKRDWSTHRVHDGDVIEVIRAVQGG
jgi:sulfur carrier protein